MNTTQEATRLTEPFAIVLPWPAKALSPNARGHWGSKSAATKRARLAAWGFTLEALGGKRPDWSAAALTWLFQPPTKRRHDVDNLVASSKASQDGIADALGIDDSKFSATYSMGEPVKGGAVIVTVRSA